MLLLEQNLVNVNINNPTTLLTYQLLEDQSRIIISRSTVHHLASMNGIYQVGILVNNHPIVPSYDVEVVDLAAFNLQSRLVTLMPNDILTITLQGNVPDNYVDIETILVDATPITAEELIVATTQAADSNLTPVITNEIADLDVACRVLKVVLGACRSRC